MDYRNHKEFSLLILVLQCVSFVHAGLEAEIHTLYAEDSFSLNRPGNNTRLIIVTFIVKQQTGVEKKMKLTESNEY